MQNTIDWYKDAVFYEVYIRAYRDSNQDGHGDIRGLIEKLAHIKDLGIDCIWVLPHYPSPLYDDGYDISDFYGIHPDYGTMDDFKHLVAEVHDLGMKIIIDLVLNHTSDQHQWFVQARKSKQSKFRDYYVWSDSNEKYKDARVIFVDTEFSNWTWDEQSGQYYWHRFYSSQPDLNYDNPAVQEEMLRVAKYWLEIGVDGFRADATPYLFEREGTNCENLPETHAYLKRLRSFIDESYPGKMILSEANQRPEDVREYFGNGDEVNMNFNFPVMPRIFMALKKGEASLIKEMLEQTPEIPDTCQWCTFLRNHDELSLEMVTPAERDWMWQQYAPEKRMRLNLGIRRRLAPLLDNEIRQILLANSLLLTLPGSPVLYYGDEIGMGDNIWLEDRDGVRTPMQWDESENAGFSHAAPASLYAPVIDEGQYAYQKVNVAEQTADPQSLLQQIRKMISIRKQHAAFGRGEFEWAPTDLPGLAAFWRTYEAERLLLVHNLTEHDQEVDLVNLVGDHKFNVVYGGGGDGSHNVKLPAYGFSWMKVSRT
jgi:maltose alpha-D-glucosyltransferase/alpha-amylase